MTEENADEFVEIRAEGYIPRRTKLPEYTGPLHLGCLNCSTAERKLTMRTALWCSEWTAARNNRTVFRGPHDPTPDDKPVRVQNVERLAAADPDHDWRIMHVTALHGEEWQRQGPKQWVLVDSNKGYA